MAVYGSPGRGLTITLHLTMGPAVLTNVPPFARGLLTEFTGEASIARKFLSDHGVTGDPFRLNTETDLADLLDTIDDRTEPLLDFDEIMRWRQPWPPSGTTRRFRPYSTSTPGTPPCACTTSTTPTVHSSSGTPLRTTTRHIVGRT
jgi:hypothetical protein